MRLRSGARGAPTIPTQVRLDGTLTALGGAATPSSASRSPCRAGTQPAEAHTVSGGAAGAQPQRRGHRALRAGDCARAGPSTAHAESRQRPARAQSPCRALAPARESAGSSIPDYTHAHAIADTLAALGRHDEGDGALRPGDRARARQRRLEVQQEPALPGARPLRRGLGALRNVAGRRSGILNPRPCSRCGTAAGPGRCWRGPSRASAARSCNPAWCRARRPRRAPRAGS